MKVMQMMKQRAKAEVTPIPTIYEEELIKQRNFLCQACSGRTEVLEVERLPLLSLKLNRKLASRCVSYQKRF
jgi:hypothetical protein